MQTRDKTQDVSNEESSIGIEKGDILYYARALENVGLFEVIEIKIRTVHANWFVGFEKGRLAYLFSNKDMDKKVFRKREDALEVVTEAEKNKKRTFSDEREYEEY